MYLIIYSGMLFFHEFRHNCTLLEIDPQCSDHGKETKLRRVQLPQPDGEPLYVRRSAFPKGRRPSKLLFLQLDHEK